MTTTKNKSSVIRHVARRVSSWRRGATPDARGLFHEYPEIRDDRQAALDVVYEEYCLLRERGEKDLAARLCRRFPTYATSVARFIEVHELMEEACPAPQDVAWPEVGDDFLHYKLTAELGRGGLARVYQARHRDMGGRLAALKISPYGGETEAITLGRLQHCGIAPGVGIERDEDSGLTAIVMEYKGWATLVELLDHCFADGLPESVETIYKVAFDPALADREEPRLLSGSYVEGVVELGVQIAKALQYAHNNHVLHGDLKPSNVLVTPWGQALLLDFNLSADAELASMRIGGTLPYCAPERLEQLFLSPPGGAPQSPLEGHAQQAELFSLGVMLYEVLTGHYPYSLPDHADRADEVAASLIQQQQTPPTQAHKWNPQADEALSEILDRCLAPRPADRPQSAGQLAEQLEGWLAQKRQAEAAAKEEQRRAAEEAQRQAAANKRFKSVIAIGLITLIAGGSALLASIGGDWRRLGRLSDEYATVRQLLADGKREKAIDLLRRIYESERYEEAETVHARVGHAVLEAENNPRQQVKQLPLLLRAYELAPIDPVVCGNLGILVSRKPLDLVDERLSPINLLTQATDSDPSLWQAAFVLARITLNDDKIDPKVPAYHMRLAVKNAPEGAFDYLMHRDAAAVFSRAGELKRVKEHLRLACELGITKAQFRRCAVPDNVRNAGWYRDLLEECQESAEGIPRRCLLIRPKVLRQDEPLLASLSKSRNVD